MPNRVSPKGASRIEFMLKFPQNFEMLMRTCQERTYFVLMMVLCFIRAVSALDIKKDVPEI